MRTRGLSSILSELPRARRLLAPLRDVREKEYGAPLPPAEFPVPAFATEALTRQEAWALFLELRADARLTNVAVTVTTAEAEPLPDFWEDACPAAERLLALRTSNAEPTGTDASNRARDWAKSGQGRRALQRAANRSIRREAVTEVEWLTSLLDPYAADRQTLYVLDVEPWAAPLALTWMFSERWAALASTMRRWHDAHGFSVVALSADMLEAYVERPPSTEDALAERLVEAVAFCSGYLDEGFEPVVTMLRGRAWRFRFDV